MGRALLPVSLTLLLAALPARAEDPAYPAGRSRPEIEGLRTVLHVPEGLSRERPASLLLMLHGAGGSAEGMADGMGAWVRSGFVVCAPQARDVTWEPADVAAARRIVAHLKKSLPIDPKRVHVLGYSNGGWNLSPLAFDDAIRPCSATWVAAGYNGGQVPRWAKEGLGVIALAGTEDPNVRAAEATVTALDGKVRRVEVRTQQGLGHNWPTALMPYLHWWMGVQEGRFVPGEDLHFEWTQDFDAALASQADARRGGVLLYVYGPGDAESEDARAVQNETLFDREVRFLGQQLACVRWAFPGHEERLAGWGVTGTPALLVFDRKGAVTKRFQGAIGARKLASALRAVAPRKSPD
jgi:predicted esterase